MANCPKCHRTYPEHQTMCPEDGELLSPDGPISADRELKRGDTVGEYVIEAKIGAGTFGEVYRGIQPLIGKQVAIKILSRRYSSDPSIVSRFIAEARAVNQIRHRNIIDIFSFGQLPDGRHYHIMELLSGTTLDVYLKHHGRLPVAEVIAILRPLARALDSAHASGIAHRDLKPANVFLARDDDGSPFPKLLDFGIAKLLTDQVPRGHQTATGAAVGTPDYMSPEQCQGPDVDHRTDIYAFGVMAYQLMTGVLPFSGTSIVEVLIKHMSQEPPAPSMVQADLPKALDAPISWMLEKNKEKRPPNLATAIGALEAAANASGIAVPKSATTGDPAATPAVFPRAPAPTSLTSDSPTVDPRARASFLSDAPFAATLPSDSRPGEEPGIPDASRRGPPALWLAIGGFIIAGVLGSVLFVQRGENEGASIAIEAPVEPRQPAALPEPPPPAARSEAEHAVAPEPKSVKIAVRTSNPELEVIGPGDVVLAHGAGVLHLPQGTEKVRLEFRAPGRVAETRDILPVADGEVAVELKKRSPEKKKTRAKRGHSAASADDIESFDLRSRLNGRREIEGDET